MPPFQFRFKLSESPIDTPEGESADLSVRFDAFAPCIVEKFKGLAEIKLIAGTHAVNASKRSAMFGVEENTTASVSIELSSIHNRLCLDKLELVFSRPIRLLNIFTTLDELSAFFADAPKTAAKPEDGDSDSNEDSLGALIANSELFGKADALIESNAKKIRENARKYADIISSASAWKFLKDAAEKSGLKSGLEKSKDYSKDLFERGRESVESALDGALETIELSGLEIAARGADQSARGAGKNETLEFAMTGEIALNSKLRRSFSRYKIPKWIAPAFSADLRTLIGQFCLDRDQGGNLSRTFLQMVESLSGSCECDVSCNDLPIDIRTEYGWGFETFLRMNRRARCHAQYAFARAQDAFDAKARADIAYDGENGENHHVDFELSSLIDTEKLILCGHRIGSPWIATPIGEGRDIEGAIRIRPCSHFSVPRIGLKAAHDWLKDEAHIQIDGFGADFSGDIAWGLDIQKQRICIHALDLKSGGDFAVKRCSACAMRGHNIDINAQPCHFESSLRKPSSGAPIDLAATIRAAYCARAQSETAAIPELGLTAPSSSFNCDGVLDAAVSCRIDYFCDDALHLAFDNSAVNVSVLRLSFDRSPLIVRQSEPSTISVRIHNARCSAGGISDCAFSLSFRAKQSPSVELNGRRAPLLPAECLDFSIDADISEHGVLTFSNGSGFYDGEFFNTLLKPNAKRANWPGILRYEPLRKHIYDLARVIVFPKIPGAEAFCARVGDWIRTCADRGIFSVSALIDPPNLAAALSLLLFGNDSAAGEFLPSIERIMNADGIDRYKIEELIDRAFPDANIGNLGRILKWVNRLFQTVPYQTPQKTSDPPLCRDPRFDAAVAPLPAANDIYADKWTPDAAERIFAYAAGLTVRQIEWILANRIDRFSDARQIEKLRRLRDLKRKIDQLESREGTFVIQDFNINVFLAALLDNEIRYCDALQLAPDTAEVSDVFRSWLSPADVAAMMTAGISSRYQSFCVQMNQARLFGYLERRGAIYARAVFCEIGRRNIRVLANMLMSWLRQDQSHVKTPINRAKRLSALLKIDIPDENAFMPWSGDIPASYVEAIFAAAERINAQNDAYFAARLKLESYRETELDDQAVQAAKKQCAISDLNASPKQNSASAQCVADNSEKIAVQDPGEIPNSNAFPEQNSDSAICAADNSEIKAAQDPGEIPNLNASPKQNSESAPCTEDNSGKCAAQNPDGEKAQTDPNRGDDAAKAEIDLINAINRAQTETAALLRRPARIAAAAGDDPSNAEDSASVADIVDSLSEKDFEFAQNLWNDAFSAARNFIRNADDPCRNPALRAFMARAADALRIASVCDDIRNGYDETRRWFACRLKTVLRRDLPDPCARSRAQMIGDIIEIFYACDEEKRDLRRDPLVWFLPPVPQGRVDLTIVTAMGIITDGSAGHELESVFKRLEQSRGIKTVRTDTGTIRPLQYNAEQIARVIAQIDGPYAVVGYSQGCPNMMKAEADLYNGTPDQRKLLDNLVSRNFICSAFNGSPHASCGVVKYKNALVEGESILKSCASSLSRPLIRLIFSAVKRILDTPLINTSLASVESISHEGLAALARDAQFAPRVPSFEISGMTRDFPQGLVMMASHFAKQAGVGNDSQVGIDCAHAYPVYNDAPAADRLRRQTISPKRLNIHHWAPLVEEVRFIESKKDIENCAYKGPKSFFIASWIDALILFGFLKIRD